MSKATKEDVLDTIYDAVADFLYYDRKEDEILPRGAIEKMIKKGKITTDEIVDAFRKALEDGVGE